MSRTITGSIQHQLGLAMISICGVLLLAISVCISTIAGRCKVSACATDTDRELGYSQADKNVATLIQGKTTERELSGGQSHSYRMRLTTGQYTTIVVEQKGVDVVVEVSLPGGQKLFEVDSPNGTDGPEPVELIAEVTGDYYFTIRSLEQKAPPGKYQIRIVDLRAATEADRNSLRAQKAFQEGYEFEKRRTAEGYSRAIVKYTESIVYWHAAGNKSQEADVLTALGSVHSTIGKTREAIDSHQNALTLRREIGDRAGEGQSLNNLGAVYLDDGKPTKALEFYAQALQIHRELRLTDREAITLSNMGEVYKQLGNLQKAVETLNLSLSLHRDQKDKRGEAKALGNIATIYLGTGDYPKAREYFDLTLTLSRETKDRQTEITALAYLGDVSSLLGDKQQALEYYSQVLDAAKKLGIRRLEGSMLGAMGRVYQSIGAIKQAIDYDTRALKLQRELDDKRGIASTLSDFAALYSGTGELQKSLDFSEQALKIRRDLNDPRGEAEELSNIGVAYKDLGDNQRALQYYNQSLPLFRSVGFTRGEANLFNSFGVVYESLGNYSKALESYEQAMQLWRKLDDRKGQSLTLRNVGTVYSTDLNQPDKALTYFQEALTLSRAISDRKGEAETLHQIGSAHLYLNNHDAAVETLNEALKIEQELYYLRGEANTRLKLSQAEFYRGSPETAFDHAEKAITLVESIRSNVAGLKTRSTFFASVQSFYRNYIDLLMLHYRQSGRRDSVATALEINERARARGLIDLLKESHTDIRGSVDQKLLDQERDLQQRISAESDNRIRLLNGKHTQAQVEAINTVVTSLSDEYDKVQTEIRSTSPRYAALAHPKPLKLSELQTEILDADTGLLEYALGAGHSYLWLITRDSLISFELPKSEIIETAGRVFHKTISARPTSSPIARREYDKAAAALSDILLKPAAVQIAACKRLLIVGDGILQFVPFAALPEPRSDRTGKPPLNALISDHEIISLPSASTISMLRAETRAQSQSRKIIAVLADPVFEPSDLRLKDQSVRSAPNNKESMNQGVKSFLRAMNGGEPSDSIQSIPRLPYSRREAVSITSLLPQTESRVFLDFDASYENATSPELGNYRFLHIATHGLLDADQPELSGILFSMVDRQGRPQPQSLLRLGEIYNLKLPVELVVLSGCQTAIGKEIKGEGLVGLTRGFMYAGAQRVVASLWQIDDAKTADLMKHFYEGMLGPQRLAPAAALQHAQKQMWQQRIEPFYWAAFIMQGEWR